MGEDPAKQSEALFRARRAGLWGLAYRLTGSAEDADDVVQEAFARLLVRSRERPLEAPAPWLVRVTTNLGIDALRRRKRETYLGPWLPWPVETAGGQTLSLPESAPADPEVRYGQAESASYAFLIAVEALSPTQRAVLLLRDVVGSSARETADLLETSEGNVRVLHLRARRALEGYDRERCIPLPELRRRHAAVLQRFLDCLASQDVRGLEELLAESVRTETDAGGAYTALTRPLAGRARVARFYLQAARHRQQAGPRTEIRSVNHLPAALVTLERPVRRQAPRSLLHCELDPQDRIRSIRVVLAPRKLALLGVP